MCIFPPHRVYLAFTGKNAHERGEIFYFFSSIHRNYVIATFMYVYVCIRCRRRKEYKYWNHTIQQLTRSFTSKDWEVARS